MKVKTVNRVLALLMSVMMVFCFMPSITFAADSHSAADAAAVNAAIASAENGQVIKTENDITGADLVPEEKNVTNDQKRKTVTAPVPVKAPANAPSGDVSGSTEEDAVEGNSIVDTDVASIGETGYATLQEAVNAAKDGETVKLVKNAEITQTISVFDSRKITIDLAGSKVKSNLGTTFKLTKGQIVVADSVGTGVIDVDGEAFRLDGVGNNNAADAVLDIQKGVTIVSGTDCCVFIRGKATVNTAGELTSHGSYATIQSNGSANQAGTVVNVTGGSVVNDYTENGAGKGHAIYQPAIDGVTTISGGNISGSTVGVEVRGGTLTISGGTITGGSGKTSIASNGNGTTAENVAVAVSQHSTKDDIKVEIAGGTFDATTAFAEASPETSDEVTNVEVNITNGRFNGAVTAEDVNHFVKGGSFTEAVPGEYITEGSIIVKNGDGNYDVVATCTVTFVFGNSMDDKVVTLPINTKVEKPADPERTGYTFGGWLNGEEVFDFDSPVKKDITLKAKWTKAELTMSETKKGIAGNTASAHSALSVKIDGKTATTEQKENIKWTSSDESVVAVDAEGMMHYLKAGKATITAKYFDSEAFCEVTVNEATVEYTASNGKVTYYDSIPSAFSSGTYKLLADVTRTTRMTPGIVASDVTIDLNGHTLTSSATDCAILLSRTGSASAPKKFAIVDTSDAKDGKLVVNEGANAAVQVQGKYNEVTIGKGVTVDGGCVALLSENQTLTVNGTINGGKDFAIATNGSKTKNATININDGAVLTSDVTAIYLPGTGTTTISGGSITGATAVYQKSGTMNITGGEFNATGEKKEFSHNGSGANATGDAIVVESSDYPGGLPKVSITGGIFTSENAEPVASYSQDEEKYEPVKNFVKPAEGSSIISNKEIAEEELAEGYISIEIKEGENKGKFQVRKGAEITVEDIAALTFTGFEQDPELTVKSGDDVLTADDFTVEYKAKEGDKNAKLGDNNKPLNAGTYVLTVKGTGAYKTAANGTVTKEVVVDQADLSEATVSVKPSSYLFENGGPFEPAVTAYIGKNATKYELTEGTDFTVSYANNTAVGTAKATITAKDGGNFKGTKEKTYKINAAAAKVDDTYYATLAAAIKAVKDTPGKTVEILKDQEASGVFNRFTMDDSYDFNLDLGGKTLTMNGAYFTLNGAKMTVTNGTINTKGNFSQEFTVNSGELNITESATINGTGEISPIAVFGSATINIAGKLTAENSFAIAGNGSAGKGGYTINITDGEVISTGASAVYHPNEGTVNISGGTITGTTAVYQKSGTLNITGGELNATGEKKEFTHNGNGAGATGDAIVIENCGYPGGSPVTNISGGTVISKNAEPVASYAYGDGNNAEEDFVTGGVFNKEIADEVIAPGYGIKSRDDGMYEIHKHEVKKTEAIAPTCLEDGNIEYYTCEICGKFFEDEQATKQLEEKELTVLSTGKEHDWNDWVIVMKPTCTEPGLQIHDCKNDPTHKDYEVIKPTGHKITKVDAVAATCEEDGNIEYYTCENCGKFFSDAAGKTEITEADTIITAKGHDWDEGKVTTEATCETDGVKTFTCANDKSHTKTEVIPAIGHKWSEWKTTKEATCSEKGTEERICENDAEHKETREIPVDPKTHKWGEWKTTKEATCSKTGTEERICANDESHKETRDIAIDNNSHDWDELIVINEATCTKNGTGYHVCKNDGTHIKMESIPATGHNLKKVDAVAATCEEDGNIEYYTCENCGKFFSDAAGKTEITEADTIITAKGHDWDEGKVTTEATCETDGVKTFTCANDKSHTKTEVIPAIGHKWSEWKTTKEATCSEKGTEERICENDAEHKETREISVDPSKHDWGEWIISEDATCTKDGSRYRVCKYDKDHRQVEDIKATGHNLKKVDAVAETCEEDGNIEYYTCENCGEFFKDAKGTEVIAKEDIVVKAKGHDWDEGTVTKEPTTEEEGVKTFTCKNDPAHTKTEPIPKLETEKKPEPDNTADQDKKPETQNQDPGNTTDQGNQSGQQNEDLEQMSSDVTAVGPGVSASIAEKAITSMKNDNDPAGSSFSKLRLRSPRQAKKAVKLSWSKVPGAAKYVLYGNQCGSKNKMKKIATLKKNSLNVKKAVKKLKKGTYYKFLIVAIDNNDNVVSTSKVIHVATKGSRKAANPKKVIVKAKVNKNGRKLKKYKVTSAIALKAGKTTQLKANITKPKKSKVRKHVNPRYESANTKIATVTSKGKVRGVKKGKTTIYVYAQNGIFKAVKVRVK